MKFTRNNLTPLAAEDKSVKGLENSVVEDAVTPKLSTEVVEDLPTPIKEVVVDAVCAAAICDASPAPTVEETLEERYAIPQFEPKIGAAKIHDEFPKSTEVKLAAEDIKHIEGATEIPEDAEVVDGVEIVGDLAPEVEQELTELTSVLGDEIPTQPTTAVEGEHTVEDEREGSTESAIPRGEAQGVFADVWGKFVDNVIVPTLITCLDKVVSKTKDYILNVVAPDLKKNNPDVK